ncbi:RDD family protein [Planotetraspora sp. GP83]|uniref:RDD family protein n=1 Tax=Planotetraspora sp. GP83 TaxID=3156264 RepID=UPI0035170631
MTITSLPLAAKPLAARRHRFAAHFIDGVIYGLATAPLTLHLHRETSAAGRSVLTTFLDPYTGNPRWPVEVAGTILFTIYFWLLHARWGQTLGKRLCRLKVVSSATGEAPGIRDSGLRALVHPLLTAIPYLGPVLYLADALWIFADSDRRCLHDVIAKTVVIDLRDPHRSPSGRSGLLIGLGILLALFMVVAVVSTLLAR